MRDYSFILFSPKLSWCGRIVCNWECFLFFIINYKAWNYSLRLQFYYIFVHELNVSFQDTDSWVEEAAQDSRWGRDQSELYRGSCPGCSSSHSSARQTEEHSRGSEEPPNAPSHRVTSIYLNDCDILIYDSVFICASKPLYLFGSAGVKFFCQSLQVLLSDECITLETEIGDETKNIKIHHKLTFKRALIIWWQYSRCFRDHGCININFNGRDNRRLRHNLGPLHASSTGI